MMGYSFTTSTSLKFTYIKHFNSQKITIMGAFSNWELISTVLTILASVSNTIRDIASKPWHLLE